MSESPGQTLPLLATPFTLPFGSGERDSILSEENKKKFPISKNLDRESSRLGLLFSCVGSIALGGLSAGLASSAVQFLLVGATAFGLIQAGTKAYYEEKYHAALESTPDNPKQWTLSGAVGIFGRLVLLQLASAAVYTAVGAAAGAMVGAPVAGVGAAGGALVGAALGFSLAMGLSGATYYRDSVLYRRRAKDIQAFRNKDKPPQKVTFAPEPNKTSKLSSASTKDGSRRIYTGAYIPPRGR